MRRILVVLGVGAAMLGGVTYSVRPEPAAEAQVAPGDCAALFNFTGVAVSFTVPAGLTQVELDVYGAAGGESATAGSAPPCRTRSSRCQGVTGSR
jgi:hypothetical protein